MVSNTRELLPEPETPVNTVNRRFGISMLTSLRLLARAPCTWITSWPSAACGDGDGVLVAGAFLGGAFLGGALLGGVLLTLSPSAHHSVSLSALLSSGPRPT